MKYIYSLLLSLVFIINCYANEKIAFIDVNFIFNNSEAGIDLKEKISKKNNVINTQINDYKIQIETQRKSILSQKNVLSVEEYNKKISALEIKITDMNKSIASKKKELSIFQKQAENNFSVSLNNLIQEFSLENSIDIILKKENLLMAKKNLDITQQIFSLFNEKVKKINLN